MRLGVLLPLALVLAAPLAAGTNLETVLVDPHSAPVEAEIEALGGRNRVEPIVESPAPVPARVPRVAPPSQDATVEDPTASDAAGAHVHSGGASADPASWRAGSDATLGGIRAGGLALDGVRLSANGRGDALVHPSPSRILREERLGAPAPRAHAPASSSYGLAAPPASPPALSDAPAALLPAPREGERSPSAASSRLERVTIPGTPTAAWRTAAAVAAGAVLVLVPALLALYHRLRGPRTLENAKRARLAELLRERPGLTATEAARELGVDRKTACYHLDRLVTEGLAVVEDGLGRPRYFAPGAARAEERSAIVAATDSARVLDAIREAPGLTQTEYARGLGLARSTVRWHLRRLHAASLIRFEREGRGVRVHPARAA